MYKYFDIKPDQELVDLGFHCSSPRHDYSKMVETVNGYIKKNDAQKFYDTIRVMAEVDLWSFCLLVLKYPPEHICHPFLMQRIYDVQDVNNNTVDLWAREHWKSSIITKALTIWTWIHNPEERQAIFSHTRGISKGFLRDIKIELEGNEILQTCWPHIFYQNPSKEAPKWSEEDGLFVKRKTKLKEASLEAHGLVDGLPTGKHFTIRIYDDPIDTKNVSTGAQMRKALDMYQQSINLGSRGGKQRVIGTRYSSGDIYNTIIKGKKTISRIIPAEVDNDGKAMFHGKPVFLTREELDEKFETQSEFIYSSQMLQDPVAKSEQKFSPEWLRYYSKRPYLNLYMVVDPSGKKGKTNDYTVIAIIGVDSMRNYFLVDMIRDKMNLGERWTAVKSKVQEWGIINPVGYEQYGMQADLDYFQERMDAEGFYFTTEALGGQTSKEDRIKKLVPLFSRGRFLMPYSLPYVDLKGEFHELVLEFITEEYEKFPYSAHDDMFDCMARIMDGKMNVTFPTSQIGEVNNRSSRHDPLSSDDGETISWMAI